MRRYWRVRVDSDSDTYFFPAVAADPYGAIAQYHAAHPCPADYDASADVVRAEEVDEATYRADKAWYDANGLC